MFDVLSERIILGIMTAVGCTSCLGLGLFYSLWKADKDKIKKWKEKFNKVLSQKKSSEVRLGKTAEHLAPFIKEWPYDPERFRFLGNPVDGISINEDNISFIEIKTGKSSLTKSQKHAKRLVKEGKVTFETFRISEDGVSIHREEMISCGKEAHVCICPNKDTCNGENKNKEQA